MRNADRLVRVALVVALLGSGVATPLAASAQGMPLPTPGKRASAPEVEKAPEPGAREMPAAYRVGAAAVNVFHVPGQAVMCAVGTTFSAALLALTFGSAHDTALGFVREGCFRSWVVSAEDLRAAKERRSIRPDPYLE